MANQSPHTQSEQNISFEQTDMQPDLEQRLGMGDESELPENLEGAQIAGTRSPRRTPREGPKHNTEPAPAAYEGSVTTRAPKDPQKQGISSNSSAKESVGQQKVVGAREDAQAGLNNSGKPPGKEPAETQNPKEHEKKRA